MENKELNKKANEIKMSVQEILQLLNNLGISEKIVEDCKKDLKIYSATDEEINQEIVKIVQRYKAQENENIGNGKMGIYIFLYRNKKGEYEFLKIGKAFVNTNDRFKYQHYNPFSSASNLARSLIDDDEMEELRFIKKQFYKKDIDKEKRTLIRKQTKNWIHKNCERIDIIIKTDIVKNNKENIDENKLAYLVLSFFEAYLHMKFKPKYEG